jgi:hypothetical protein
VLFRIFAEPVRWSLPAERPGEESPNSIGRCGP